MSIFFLDGGELFVAGGEGGLAIGGQGSGEAAGIRELVVGAEFGGEAGQLEIGVDDIDGELAYVFEDLAGYAGPWARQVE